MTPLSATLLVLWLSKASPEQGWQERKYLVPSSECPAKATKLRQRIRAGKVKVFCNGRQI